MNCVLSRTSAKYWQRAIGWEGLARNQRTGTEAGAMGRTFQQSSSANCGEPHLRAPSSSASTISSRTHTRPALAASSRRPLIQSRCLALNYCSIGIPARPALPPSFSYCSQRSLFLQLLDRHSPPKRRPTTSTAPACAAPRSCLAQHAAPPILLGSTADSPRTRALHQ